MMKRATVAFVVLTAVALSPVAAHAEQPMDLDGALAYLASYAFGDSRAPLEAISEAARDPQQQDALEQRFIALLDSGGTPPAAKRFICRMTDRAAWASLSWGWGES